MRYLFLEILDVQNCTSIIVSAKHVTSNNQIGKSGTLRVANGKKYKVPKAKINVNSPYFLGSATALVFNTDIDLIIRNIPGAKCLCETTDKIKDKKINLNDNIEPLRKVISSESQQFKIDQNKDDTLKTCLNINDHNIRNGSKKVDIENDKLYLPPAYKKNVEMGHDNHTGDHMSSYKTQKVIENYFHWPGMKTKINKFCYNLIIILITLLFMLSANPFKKLKFE